MKQDNFFWGPYKNRMGFLKTFGNTDILTNFELVNVLIKQIENIDKPKFIKVLDPSCGRGPFLVLIYEYLFNRYYRHIDNIEERNYHCINSIWGCDIESRYVKVTIKELERIQKYYGSKNIITPNIFNCDFMKKKFDMNFSVILGNPPFKRGLHYKFCNKSFELLEENGILMMIHPSNFALSKSFDSKGDEKKFQKIVMNNKSCLTFIDGNKYFHGNAGFFTPLSISQVEKIQDVGNIKINYDYLETNKTIVHQDFTDVYIHGNNIVKQIVEKVKIKNLPNFLDKSTKKNIQSNFFVRIPAIRGHASTIGKPNPDFSTIISKEQQNDILGYITNDYNQLDGSDSDGTGKRGIIAENMESAVNIVKFMKTKFCRFMLSTEKIGGNIWSGSMIKSIPYMNFTLEWSDESLFNFFELTEDERSYINNYIEKFYDCD
jgi:hypothetical protein